MLKPAIFLPSIISGFRNPPLRECIFPPNLEHLHLALWYLKKVVCVDRRGWLWGMAVLHQHGSVTLKACAGVFLCERTSGLSLCCLKGTKHPPHQSHLDLGACVT